MPDPRPLLARRASYHGFAGFQDYYIVSLLQRSIAGAVAEHLVGGPGRAVLDIGCGQQPLRPQLEAAGFEYVGLDVQQNTDGTVAHVLPFDEPLPAAAGLDGRFDAALCTEVLEHVEDWPTAFLNFVAVLKPGGRVVITCPFIYPLHELPHDFWRPTLYAIQWQAARAGLDVVATHQIGDRWDVLGTILGNLLGPRGLAAQPKRPGPLPWLLSQAARLGLAAAYAIVFAPVLRRWVRFDETTQHIYLSNVVVLARPAWAGVPTTPG